MINLLKFIHLLCALGIFSLVIYCFALMSSISSDKFKRLNRVIAVLCLFVIISGTFLVYPKQYTFHTPWIQAAYVFTFIVGLSALLLTLLKKKYENRYRWAWRLTYLILISILVVIIHDAVTKTALFFL